MANSKISRMKMRLSAGVFEVTAEKSFMENAPLFRVTVSDGGDEVTNEVTFGGKSRLSVQEMATTFVNTLSQAQEAVHGFESYASSLAHISNMTVSEAFVRFFHRDKLLLNLKRMDITATMIPGLIEEITEKYELNQR